MTPVTTDTMTGQDLHRLRQQLVVRCGALGIVSAAVATVHGAPVFFRVLPLLICGVPPTLAWLAECAAREHPVGTALEPSPKKVVKSS